MIKFMSLEFLGLSHRIQGKIKNAIFSFEMSELVPEIFQFKKCVNTQMSELMTSFTQPYVTSIIQIDLSWSIFSRHH